MRRTIVLVLFAALAAIGLAPTASAGDNFVAPLSGAQEVPARDTPATGVAKFKLREDGTVLLFKVNVENVTNVVAGHIPCGTVGVNGPVGVTLFMGAPAGGAFEHLTEGDLRVVHENSSRRRAGRVSRERHVPWPRLCRDAMLRES